MKAGLVVHETPTPAMSNNMTTPTGETIGTMSWEDIHKMVEKAG